MSDFFGDLGKACQRAVDGVTNEVSCAALEQKIGDAYRALGRLYYETVQRGETPEGKKFEVHTHKIAALQAELEEKRRK